MNTLKIDSVSHVPNPLHQKLIDILGITCISNKPTSEKVRKKRSLANLLCLIDFVKIRSWDQEYIAWLLTKEQIKLFEMVVICIGKKFPFYKGRCKNLDIEIRYTQKGWYVDISGSLHKYFNEGKHNHNDFYWKDFLSVYHEIVEKLRMKPSEMKVVNLEIGVNCVFPDNIKFTIAQLLEKVLSLSGKCNTKSHIVESKSDRYKVRKTECYTKMYNKAIQYGIKICEILRLEKGFIKSRQIEKCLNVSNFDDLINISFVYKSIELLKKEFETLLIYQPDFLKSIPTDLVEEDTNILEYGSREFWCSLKKASRFRYNKALIKYEGLVNQYCPYNIKVEVLKMLADKVY